MTDWANYGVLSKRSQKESKCRLIFISDHRDYREEEEREFRNSDMNHNLTCLSPCKLPLTIFTCSHQIKLAVVQWIGSWKVRISPFLGVVCKILNFLHFPAKGM